ncbi:hypothetical protein D3C84_625790 [compost metagenome]
MLFIACGGLVEVVLQLGLRHVVDQRTAHHCIEVHRGAQQYVRHAAQIAAGRRIEGDVEVFGIGAVQVHQRRAGEFAQDRLQLLVPDCRVGDDDAGGGQEQDA